MILSLLFVSFAMAQEAKPAVKVVYAPDYGQAKKAAPRAAGAVGKRLGKESRSVTNASVGKDGKVTLVCEPFKEKAASPAREIGHDK